MCPPTTPKKRQKRLNESKFTPVKSPAKASEKSVIDGPLKSPDSRSPVYSSSTSIVSSPPRKVFGPSPDRFIPNRASVDFDYCNSMLTPSSPMKEQSEKKSDAQKQYTSAVLQAGNKTSGKRMIEVFEKKSEAEAMPEPVILKAAEAEPVVQSPKRSRIIPSVPYKILDAPELLDDYYLNLLSWGSPNILAVALQKSVYLWHAEDSRVEELLSLPEQANFVTSVQWSPKDHRIAVGTNLSTVQIWDVETSTKISELDGHTARVSALSWNGPNVLSSGGRDSTIINHDLRQGSHVSNSYVGHQQEVCGLAWSFDGMTLASGGNDNMLCFWDAAMSGGGRNSVGGRLSLGTSSVAPVSLLAGAHAPRSVLRDHCAAVKALAWCPFNRNVLASGGGTADRCIRIWNASTSAQLHCVDTGSQV
jgi:cell division cycle protein 20 (cofactor of APC complex)